jgi:serine/threonine protein kinase
LKATHALGVVHRQGIQHRDIKPDNLLVREADGEPVWVDFGVWQSAPSGERGPGKHHLSVTTPQPLTSSLHLPTHELTDALGLPCNPGPLPL